MWVLQRVLLQRGEPVQGPVPAPPDGQRGLRASIRDRAVQPGQAHHHRHPPRKCLHLTPHDPRQATTHVLTPSPPVLCTMDLQVVSSIQCSRLLELQMPWSVRAANGSLADCSIANLYNVKVRPRQSTPPRRMTSPHTRLPVCLPSFFHCRSAQPIARSAGW